VTGSVTNRVVKKAWEAFRSIRREYMMFTSAEEALRIVLHPETYKAITKEFWDEQRQRGPGQGYWVEQVHTSSADGTAVDDRMLGIKIMTDANVPEGEVEIRAVLVHSWEAV
jgi:hypothetical protein